MARSVSTPTGAIKIAYAAIEYSDIDDAQYEFDDAVDNLRYCLQQAYPSLRRCSEWIGREDRAVLANDHAFITVSEYCGLVAVCVVPKNESKKAITWCERCELKVAVSYFGTPLISRGRFSNGEQIFEAAAPAKNKGEMGLGFTSKEDWL